MKAFNHDLVLSYIIPLRKPDELEFVRKAVKDRIEMLELTCVERAAAELVVARKVWEDLNQP